LAIIKGAAGNVNDTKIGTSGIDQIYGYGGNDTLSGRNGNDSIWGGDGNDKLLGENNDDLVWGGNGNDVIYGGAGNDSLYGDAGTDTLKGEAGNDILKGGTGISYLYGGDGNDQIYYNPTPDSINKVGQYLKGSTLDGGSGYDTLNLFNQSTYASGTTQKASQTSVYIEEGRANISFLDPNAPYEGPRSYVGTANSIEKIVVEGNGGLDFIGDLYGNVGVDITGTAKNDLFQSYYASDTMRGGAGNDHFFAGGGNDKIISLENDADTFEFNGWGGTTTVTGFNGEGVYGGDRVNIPKYYFDGKPVESNGWTTFSLTSGDVVKVDAVGLDEGVDYFFV
jgi:Ca2+-binding RTX toxin-like protein